MIKTELGEGKDGRLQARNAFQVRKMAYNSHQIKVMP